MANADDIPFFRQLPKVELHAHLHGSIRRSTLQELIDHSPEYAHVRLTDKVDLTTGFLLFDMIHRFIRKYLHQNAHRTQRILTFYA